MALETAPDSAAPGALILAKWRDENAAKAGSPCANCAAPVGGPYCCACGQAAVDFERSVGALLTEAVENLFHADGRLQHTVPRLALKPAALTREYLAGRRASQAPPLRMFLVVILVFFFAGSLRDLRRPNQTWLFKKDSPTDTVPTLTPGADPVSRAFAAWLNPRLTNAVTHQQEFGAAIGSQSHRVAIIFLPIATLLLGLLFVNHRRFFLFDHAIFSMHSLSFMGLLFTVVTLLSIGHLRGLAALLTLAAPAHLFVHFRGVYGTSIIGTMVRMFLLFILSLIAMTILVLATVGMELNVMGTTSA